MNHWKASSHVTQGWVFITKISIVYRVDSNNFISSIHDPTKRSHVLQKINDGMFEGEGMCRQHCGEI